MSTIAPSLLNQLRDSAALVAERARHVRINQDAVPGYAAALPLSDPPPAVDETPGGSPEDRAALWLSLDAVNFGSGWFPTLKKRPGQSGYHTVAGALKDRFAASGPWSPGELQALTAAEIAETLGQDPAHELMALFAGSLRDLGRNVEPFGSFHVAVDQGSAVGLLDRLATWPCFADVSTYEDLTIPFLKRAQIAVADLARAKVIEPQDLGRLTMFADNLVPHVLRLDGVLSFGPQLVARIERQELIEHGSPEEIEIRACALHAVELIVARRPETTAADVDQLLWLRGQSERYKASPRHRSRCTAY